MSYKGMDTIRESFLNESELFGLEFNEGFVFLEVEGWEQVKYAPYSGVGEVSAANNSGYSRLEDGPSSDDILFVDSGQNKVLHVGIGQRPEFIRRYTRYPENGSNLRTVPNLNGPSSRNGEDFGYVDGVDSPYGEPTVAEELMIPPDVHLDFDFYNPDPNNAHTPILDILMRIYDVRALDSNNSQDLRAIKNIVRPGSAPPVYKAGTIDNKINYQLTSDWGVSPLSQSRVTDLRRNQ